jgi:hypothetical protein
VNPIEWLPFLEALDRTGAYSSADELVISVGTGGPHAVRALKAILADLRAEHVHGGQPIDQIDHQISLLPAD